MRFNLSFEIIDIISRTEKLCGGQQMAVTLCGQTDHPLCETGCWFVTSCQSVPPLTPDGAALYRHLVGRKLAHDPANRGQTMFLKRTRASEVKRVCDITTSRARQRRARLPIVTFRRLVQPDG